MFVFLNDQNFKLPSFKNIFPALYPKCSLANASGHYRSVCFAFISKSVGLPDWSPGSAPAVWSPGQTKTWPLSSVVIPDPKAWLTYCFVFVPIWSLQCASGHPTLQFHSAKLDVKCWIHKTIWEMFTSRCASPTELCWQHGITADIINALNELLFFLKFLQETVLAHTSTETVELIGTEMCCLDDD